MNEILDEALALLDGGEDFALVKLIGDRGSTPRAAGAEMLVRRDGSIAGTIGGGLLELTVMRKAADVLESRTSRVVDLRLAGRDLASDEEMVCGGSAEVLITYVPPGDSRLEEVLRAVKAARTARRRAWLFTLLPLEEGGEVETCLLDDDGVVVGAQCDPRALRTAVGKIAVHGSTRLPDGRQVVVEYVGAPATAIVCGGGHVGRALAPAALAAGFAVTVVDDREEFADPRRFPGAKVVLGSFDGALERIGVDEASYVVIVTRGHTHDMDVLVQALRTPARYIGLMASRSKRARMVEALRDAGMGEDQLARVHSPVGLDIGAETPAELAVSIVAEMIQVRAGKTV
ncbi:MAG: XdhC family protein [Actinobacteria bacterium]|nr:XdhC family protein [Actinomycetota bacterium]